jgi:hypothetical protein
VAKAYPKEFDDLSSTNDTIRFNALKAVLKQTEKKVDWTYLVWDQLIANLRNENSYQRSIAVMVLCNLAKSDPEKRIRKSIKSLLNLTRDEKFITSRQCIQSIWKVAGADPELEGKVIEHLEELYRNCQEAKHYNLIRQDIIQSIANLYGENHSEEIMKKAFELIQEEKDTKYKKKYLTCLDPKHVGVEERT